MESQQASHTPKVPQTLNQHILKHYLHDLLNVDQFKDYCPNGLQVAHGSNRSIAKIISGVTLNQSLINQAIAQKADAILVHHGLFWKGDAQSIDGLLYHRLSALIEHQIALFAYHLPLDAHLIYGNNAQLGLKFNFSSDAFAGEQNLIHIHQCSLDNPITAQDLVTKIEAALGKIYLDSELNQNLEQNLEKNVTLDSKTQKYQITHQIQTPPLQYIDAEGHIFGSELLATQKTRRFQTIAWCSGGAQSYLPAAIAAGADVFITGEISEQYVHIAREAGIAYIAAGHHATERFAVQALGAHLATHFGIEHQYIDVLSLV